MTVTAREIEALYRAHAPRLRRWVGSEVQTSDVVIEDACQQAWSTLLDQRERVRGDGLLTWLTRTAVHEALRHVRRDENLVALEQAENVATTHSPPEVAEIRERLKELTQLPHRQRRLVWLHAAGFNYMDMARCEGVSRRTVERQLLRGKRALCRGASATPSG